MTQGHDRDETIDSGAIAPPVIASALIGGSIRSVASLRGASVVADPGRAAKGVSKRQAGFSDEPSSTR